MIFRIISKFKNKSVFITRSFDSRYKVILIQMRGQTRVLTGTKQNTCNIIWERIRWRQTDAREVNILCSRFKSVLHWFKLNIFFICRFSSKTIVAFKFRSIWGGGGHSPEICYRPPLRLGQYLTLFSMAEFCLIKNSFYCNSIEPDCSEQGNWNLFTFSPVQNVQLLHIHFYNVILYYLQKART